MPIYEYSCACGKTFEVLVVRKSDEEEVKCPDCGGTQVRRVIGAPNRLRGFHEYRRPEKPRW